MQNQYLKAQGVTAFELMLVVGIIGTLSAVAVPMYQDIIVKNQLMMAVESLRSDMQYARTQALKKGQNVVISRTPGTTGSWCYGLNVEVNCNCKVIGSCLIKTISGSDFGTAINMASSSSSNSTFDLRRGTIGANGVNFTTDRYVARVVFSNVGRVRICTPIGNVGLPSYPYC